MRGFDRDKMMFLPVTAQVKEVEVSEQAVRDAINLALEKANQRTGQEQAAVDPVGPNQKPRMLQLSAWICHAGDKPNLNGAAFKEQDLAEVVNAGLFQPPFFGMIDFNHDFNSYGAWFKAQYAFDQQAGQWGILAEGAIFAWRYTDLADKLLAMQARLGHIDVSMACMPSFYEPAETADGTPFVFLRKPVFFTTSVLDVDPADPKARALGTEDVSASGEAQRTNELLAAMNDTPTEESMKVENQEEVVTEQVEEVVEQTATTEVASQETVAEETATTEEAPIAENVEETVETAADEVVAEVTEQVEEQVVTAAELQTQIETLTVALNAANTQLSQMNDELTTLRQFKADRDAADLAVAQAALREARMQEIPESIAEEMAKDENKALLDEWMTMDEAKWTATKKVFSVASTAAPKSRADRSAEEGTLATASDKNAGEFAISRWSRRSKK